MNILNKFFFKKYLRIDKRDIIVAEGRRINLIKWDLKKQKQTNQAFVEQLINGGLCASMKKYGEYFVLIESTVYDTKYFLPILNHEIGHIVNNDYDKINKENIMNGILMCPELEIRADQYAFRETGVKMTAEFLKDYFVGVQEYVYRIQTPYLFEGEFGLDSDPDGYQEWKHDLEKEINGRLVQFHAQRFNLNPSKK